MGVAKDADEDHSFVPIERDSGDHHFRRRTAPCEQLDVSTNSQKNTNHRTQTRPMACPSTCSPFSTRKELSLWGQLASPTLVSGWCINYGPVGPYKKMGQDPRRRCVRFSKRARHHFYAHHHGQCTPDRNRDVGACSLKSAGDSIVAITGATGYLGGVIQRHFDSMGWSTIPLVRHPTNDQSRSYAIEGPNSPDLLSNVDVLVHCAYDMDLNRPSDIWRVNVQGTKRLIELAFQTGVHRTIVLSSMSAYAGTNQLYGRAKLEIEAYATEYGAIAVRPGLVYGPTSGGMAGALVRLANLPIVPIVAARAHQYTVHEDDFADAIFALAIGEQMPTEPIGIANPIPVSFRELLLGLRVDANTPVHFFPVNWRLLFATIRFCESLGLQPPFRSDSLLGLVKGAPCVPNLSVVGSMGIVLRRFDEPVPAR